MRVMGPSGAQGSDEGAEWSNETLSWLVGWVARGNNKSSYHRLDNEIYIYIYITKFCDSGESIYRKQMGGLEHQLYSCTSTSMCIEKECTSDASFQVSSSYSGPSSLPLLCITHHRDSIFFPIRKSASIWQDG